MIALKTLWKIYHRGFLLAALGGAVLLAGCARSTALLRGEEARSYTASETDLLKPGAYTYRAVRDPHGQNLMAAVFNPGEGNFRVVKAEHSAARPRIGDNIILLIDSPDGEPGRQPHSGDLAEIENTHLAPIVILGEEGTELAIVYRPGSMPVNAASRADGTLRLELGRRTGLNQGKIDYSLSLKGSAEDSRKAEENANKEKNVMSEVKVGDLVRWEAGDKIRVGVIKSIDEDGTCAINVPTTQGSRQEKIRTARLEVITSTVESKGE